MFGNFCHHANKTLGFGHGIGLHYFVYFHDHQASQKTNKKPSS